MQVTVTTESLRAESQSKNTSSSTNDHQNSLLMVVFDWQLMIPISIPH